VAIEIATIAWFYWHPYLPSKTINFIGLLNHVQKRGQQMAAYAKCLPYHKNFNKQYWLICINHTDTQLLNDCLRRQDCQSIKKICIQPVLKCQKAAYYVSNLKLTKGSKFTSYTLLQFFVWELVFFIDHKVLPRKTPEGFTAILAMVEFFSGFCYFEAVKDQSASTTAEVLVRRIYANHPNIKGICSDKHPGFMSQLFKILTQKVLGLKHWSSSALNLQSHGPVEANIKQMSVLINLLAEDDTQIPQILPLAEMMSRLSISKPRGYSPYEMIYGFQPDLGLFGKMIQKSEPVPTVHEYVTRLQQRLKLVHQNVTENVTKARAEQKAAFDKRSKVVTPNWQVGDRVWLEQKTPGAGSPAVLTHKRFGSSPFLSLK
jgi:hypothetical protein